MKHFIFITSLFITENAFADEVKMDKDIDAALLDTQNSTKFNFEEMGLEGKIKTPNGMMLNGRVEQTKNLLVKLRSNFRDEIRKSRSSVMLILPK